MDQIRLQGLQFEASHGAYPEEADRRQPFVVDVVFYADLSGAAASDRLQRTIDYAKAYREVEGIVLGVRIHLLETLASRLAEHLLAWSGAERVAVTVHKPAAPLPGPVRDVAVQVVRARRP